MGDIYNPKTLREVLQSLRVELLSEKKSLEERVAKIEYQETFRSLAEYFKSHPHQYQIALDYGSRLARLAQLPEDDPEIDALARESAEFIISIQKLKELLCNQPGIKKPLESLYCKIVAEVIPPAQMKFQQLIEQYPLKSQKA